MWCVSPSSVSSYFREWLFGAIPVPGALASSWPIRSGVDVSTVFGLLLSFLLASPLVTDIPAASVTKAFMPFVSICMCLGFALESGLKDERVLVTHIEPGEVCLVNTRAFKPFVSRCMCLDFAVESGLKDESVHVTHKEPGEVCLVSSGVTALSCAPCAPCGSDLLLPCRRAGNGCNLLDVVGIAGRLVDVPTDFAREQLDELLRMGNADAIIEFAWDELGESLRREKGGRIGARPPDACHRSSVAAKPPLEAVVGFFSGSRPAQLFEPAPWKLDLIL